MLAKVYGKVNLSLAVTGKRNDLHTLDTIMCSVEICDEIRLVPRKDDKVSIAVECADEDFVSPRFIPIIQGAVDKFFAKFGRVGADIKIKKYLPLGAGLGGSSASIVGVIKLLCALKGVTADDAFLLSLGSDVPFMWRGGAARVTGVGEEVQLFDAEPLTLVIAKPVGKVDTKECYARFDQLNERLAVDNGALKTALETGDIGALEPLLLNDLQRPAYSLNEAVEPLVKSLKGAGAQRVVMSGSGSAVVAVCATLDEALGLSACIDGASVAVVSSREDGVETCL